VKRTYLTVNEAATVARVKPNTVRRWMTAGRLTKYKIEGRVLVDAAELDRKLSPVTAGAAR
jgi:excisionase family DNA binding protein